MAASEGSIPTPMMASAWQDAADDLGIRFVSPYEIRAGEQTLQVTGWLPDFGGPRGSLILGRHDVDGLFDLADELGFNAPGLSPSCYETYDRRLYVELLDDLGWFGRRGDAPAWFRGRVG